MIHRSGWHCSRSTTAMLSSAILRHQLYARCLQHGVAVEPQRERQQRHLEVVLDAEVAEPIPARLQIVVTITPRARLVISNSSPIPSHPGTLMKSRSFRPTAIIYFL